MKKENTNEKIFWVIGIALIIFLILVLGSIIGLKMVRKGIHNVVDGNGQTTYSDNNIYEVDEDGVKRNVYEGITDAEVDVDLVRFSQFTIMERVLEMGEDNNEIECDLGLDIENMTEEPMENAAYTIRFYNIKGEELANFNVLLNLPSREPIHITLSKSNVSFIEATHVEIEREGANAKPEENVSGAVVTEE